jgi:hypothetical protein
MGMKHLMLLMSAAIVITTTAEAQVATTPPAKPPAPTTELVALSCADFLSAARSAVAPKGAKAARLAEAKAAQDDIAYGLIWLHGYQSGQGQAMAKLDKAWLEGAASRLTRRCKGAADPAKVRLVDLVKS